MFTLPLPLVVALILGFLTLQHAIAGDRPMLFLALLVACAIQALVVSLGHHYGFPALLLIQPVTAVVAPPLAWLAFQCAAYCHLELKRDLLHILGPIFTAFCVYFVPAALDVLLPTIFAGYGIAILVCLNNDASLPLTRLAAGPLPARIWQAIGAMLILSSVSDVLIAIALELGLVDLRPLIISVLTSLTLLGMGLLSLSRDAEGDTDTSMPPEHDSGPSTDVDSALMMSRLDALMERDRPYLDPDLTLARLARCLHVPIKQLSATINRVKKENVSRYVNGYRIRDACVKLSQGDNVTKTIFSSGFNTKSNFNREFVRIMGQSPTAFQRSQGLGTSPRRG